MNLEKRNPGLISHARWLTTANRILRLYIGTRKPSHNLKALVTFIVKVYAPMWFNIKMEPKCVNGAKHFWKMISLSRYLPNNLRKIVDDTLQRNGYFTHSENILLAMLTDGDDEIRKNAVDLILKYVYF